MHPHFCAAFGGPKWFDKGELQNGLQVGHLVEATESVLSARSSQGAL
jgi:hypothetical protein